ncbi:MAG: citryl-CoA lyase [Candidatus Aminicenantes bacterium]|nr:citryl-CoA lyase [Candidatus Aminicenantes bacterium]
MSDLHWKTAISDVEPNKVKVRGYPVDQLIGRISFAQAVYLVWKGEMPSPEVGKLIDAILVSSVDHGAGPPSVLTARTVTSTGAELNSAVAAGIQAISRYHGGAIEEGMRLFIRINTKRKETGDSLEKAVQDVLKEMKSQKQRASGFGHRLHKQDPRTQRLFALARDLGLAGEHMETALAVEKGLKEVTGRSLPMNVDGAIAALLCDLEIPPEIGNAFFILSRVAGLVAHVHEEKTKMRPMRKIHPTDFEYDGPSERKL